MGLGSSNPQFEVVADPLTKLDWLALGYAVTPQPPAGATRVFVSPWPSKPEGGAPSGAVADLEGVYLDWDIQLPKAEGLYDAYVACTRTGGLWNFQTNLPFKVSSFGESAYQKHALGDTIVTSGESYDLLTSAIEMNDD